MSHQNCSFRISANNDTEFLVGELKGGVGITEITNKTKASFKHSSLLLPKQSTIEDEGKKGLMTMMTARELTKNSNGNQERCVLEVPECGWSLTLLISARSSRAPLRNANVNNTEFVKNCPPTPRCQPDQMYRTIDGSCNNLRIPKFGMAKTTFARVMENAYDDGSFKSYLFICRIWLLLYFLSLGFHSPRGSGDPAKLPSPRLISQRLARSHERTTPLYSMMTMTFGQFVDHDLTLTPVFTRESFQHMDGHLFFILLFFQPF